MPIVAKFGGSIFKNEQAYEDVALELSVLRAKYDKVYAVVSAKKGETERLMREVAGDNSEDINELAQALMGYYGSKFDKPEVPKKLIQGEFDSVDKLVEILGQDYAIGVKKTGNYPIIARGSYLGFYLYGIVLLPESRLKARELQHSAPIEIISGFGAINMNGDVVLLGRNASDYIAGIFAYMYDVDKIIFYKDVDGIYDKNQRKLDVLTRQEFLKLGNLQVLEQRVLDVYGGEMLIRDLYSFDENVRISLGGISIIMPKPGTTIKGLY